MNKRYDPNQPRVPAGSSKGGQWAKRNEAERIYNNVYVDSINLPDEVLPRSVGAQWANHKILMPDGTYAKFVEGSKLQNKEVFAGKGCRRKIDEIDRLVAKYGGDPNEWMKVKAIAYIRKTNGEIDRAEVHWYEEKTAGKHKFKVKRSM